MKLTTLSPTLLANLSVVRRNYVCSNNGEVYTLKEKKTSSSNFNRQAQNIFIMVFCIFEILPLFNTNDVWN